MHSANWTRSAVASLAAMIGLAFAIQSVRAADDNPPVVVYSANNAPKTPTLADLPLKDSVSQYGVTWTFDKPVPVGRFINGDWYFVGPATVKAIDPKPLTGQEVPTDSIGDDERKDRKDAFGERRSMCSLCSFVESTGWIKGDGGGRRWNWSFGTAQTQAPGLSLSHREPRR